MSELKVEVEEAGEMEAPLNPNILSTDPEAQNPHLYSAPAQPAAEDEVADFMASLINLLKPELVLETGTAFGDTAEKLAYALKNNGTGRLITCEKKQARIDKAKPRLLDGRRKLPVEFIEGTWQQVQLHPNAVIDMAFFDASREMRDKEFLHFYPNMRKGTFVIFHDTGLNHSARPAVIRLEDLGLIKAIHIPTPRGISFCKVEKAPGE